MFRFSFLRPAFLVLVVFLLASCVAPNSTETPSPPSSDAGLTTRGEMVIQKSEMTMNGGRFIVAAVRVPSEVDEFVSFNEVRLYVFRNERWNLIDTVSFPGLRGETELIEGDLSRNGVNDFLIREKEINVAGGIRMAILEPTPEGFAKLFPSTPQCSLRDLDGDLTEEVVVEARYAPAVDPARGFWYVEAIYALKNNRWELNSTRFRPVYEAIGEAAYGRYTQIRADFTRSSDTVQRPGQMALLLAFAEAALNLQRSDANAYRSFVLGEVEFLQRSLSPAYYEVLQNDFIAPLSVPAENTASPQESISSTPATPQPQQ